MPMAVAHLSVAMVEDEAEEVVVAGAEEVMLQVRRETEILRLPGGEKKQTSHHKRTTIDEIRELGRWPVVDLARDSIYILSRIYIYSFYRRITRRRGYSRCRVTCFH
jgi:hypothetical protein